RPNRFRTAGGAGRLAHRGASRTRSPALHRPEAAAPLRPRRERSGHRPSGGGLQPPARPDRLMRTLFVSAIRLAGALLAVLIVLLPLRSLAQPTELVLWHSYHGAEQQALDQTVSQF